jgi:hypothetical protein
MDKRIVFNNTMQPLITRVATNNCIVDIVHIKNHSFFPTKLAVEQSGVRTQHSVRPYVYSLPSPLDQPPPPIEFVGVLPDVVHLSVHQDHAQIPHQPSQHPDSSNES